MKHRSMDIPRDNCDCFQALGNGAVSTCFNDLRPNSLKQVVTASLTNARKQVLVSRVLGDDHYKEQARVTVGVTG